MNPNEIEIHPLKPFLPANAKILLLGSFPPPHKRWSMEFFYPNLQNDMWRILGQVFYYEKEKFVVGKSFDYEAIIAFCNRAGIAIYDTATKVRRLKGNASDQFLEIVEPTNVRKLLEKLPECKAIITTGEKATVQLAETLKVAMPKINDYVEIVTHPPVEKDVSETSIEVSTCRFYRLPSSSRAYPLAFAKKVEAYRAVLQLFFPKIA